jgi:hypothetical protein
MWFGYSSLSDSPPVVSKLVIRRRYKQVVSASKQETKIFRLKVGHCFVLFSSGPKTPNGLEPPHSRGFYITHKDAPQSIRLLSTSDQPVAETSAWQYTTFTTDRYRWAPAGFGPTISAGQRPQTDVLDRAATGFWNKIKPVMWLTMYSVPLPYNSVPKHSVSYKNPYKTLFTNFLIFFCSGFKPKKTFQRYWVLSNKAHDKTPTLTETFKFLEAISRPTGQEIPLFLLHPKFFLFHQSRK